MQLALAALHARPTDLMTMIDGRTLGVARATLTSGEHAAVIVPPSLLAAFAIARDDLASTPSKPFALTVAYRADGHLQLHGVGTRSIWIDGGASSVALTLEVDSREADAAVASTAILPMAA